MVDNAYISNLLRELSIYFRYKDDNFRANVFSHASKIIKNMPEQITDPDAQLHQSGIGEGVRDRVREILNTGKLTELDDFQQVKNIHFSYGIGTATKKRLQQQGIQSQAQLKANIDTAKLTKNQLLGIMYYDDFNKKIPREEVKKFGEHIISVIHNIDSKSKAEIVGSYRRQVDFSGDIDILFTNNQDINHLEDIVLALMNEGFIIKTLLNGKVKYQGIYNSAFPGNSGIMRKFDMRFVPHDAWAAALLHFTGDGDFNRYMRRAAIKKGYTLSEYGLKYMLTGDYARVNNEKDIFDLLNVKYVEPALRNQSPV